MTVGELKQVLNHFPDDVEVNIQVLGPGGLSGLRANINSWRSELSEKDGQSLLLSNKREEHEG